DPEESIVDAMYRELWEETGLLPEHVKIMGCTRHWLRYRLPHWVRRRHRDDKPDCVGQKQRWFMLRLVGEEDSVCLDQSDKPEFDHWEWVDYWKPVEDVVFFKRRVYLDALNELAHLVYPNGLPSEAQRSFAEQRKRCFRRRSGSRGSPA
ncbi:MAG: RNA pyrophosphohydrolase, partial [Gammaproteobacteria bacterium]